MDSNGFKDSVRVYAFGLVSMAGVATFIVSTMVTLHTFALFRRPFITTLSKRFKGINEEEEGEEVVNEITSSSRRRRRRLNLSEIISHIFWYHTISATFTGFIWAVVPEEFYPILEAYYRPNNKKDKDKEVTRYNVRIRTHSLFKNLLNNPSETAADFAETFTRCVLADLGFHHLSPSSSSSSNHNLNYYEYPGYTDYHIAIFEEVLIKSCFGRKLAERLKSIDWDNAGVPPPPTRLTDFEKRVLMMFYVQPDDDEWIESLNNWLNWYIKTIHERIFPSEDFQVVEATVKFLFFSFMHDTAAPFISLFALVGVTTS